MPSGVKYGLVYATEYSSWLLLLLNVKDAELPVPNRFSWVTLMSKRAPRSCA